MRGEGLEPTPLSGPGPKPGASANSATLAGYVHNTRGVVLIRKVVSSGQEIYQRGCIQARKNDAHSRWDTDEGLGLDLGDANLGVLLTMPGLSA